jgi:hypothetical protein
MFRVKGRAGERCLVAFYLDNDNKDAEQLKKFKVGTVLVIAQPWAKIFMDGQVGIRLEDEDVKDVKVSRQLRNHTAKA